MSALLVPSIVTAKTTKRSRAAKRDATVAGGKTTDRPSRVASKSTRSKSVSRSASRSVSKRSGSANRKATVRKGSRSYRRYARASHRRPRHARSGERSTVDEHIHVRKGDTLENIARGPMSQSPAFQFNGQPVIDPANTFYIGGSLGGNMGNAFMAYDPNITKGVLAVPGGNWCTCR